MLPAGRAESQTRPADRHSLNGIGNQIGEHLRDLAGDAKEAKILPTLADDRHLAIADLARIQLEHVLEKRVDGAVLLFQSAFAGPSAASAW